MKMDTYVYLNIIFYRYSLTTVSSSVNLVKKTLLNFK